MRFTVKTAYSSAHNPMYNMFKRRNIRESYKREICFFFLCFFTFTAQTLYKPTRRILAQNTIWHLEKARGILILSQISSEKILRTANSFRELMEAEKRQALLLHELKQNGRSPFLLRCNDLLAS